MKGALFLLLRPLILSPKLLTLNHPRAQVREENSADAAGIEFKEASEDLSLSEFRGLGFIGFIGLIGFIGSILGFGL